MNRIFYKHLQENLYLGSTLTVLEDTQLVVMKINKLDLDLKCQYSAMNTSFHMFNSYLCIGVIQCEIIQCSVACILLNRKFSVQEPFYNPTANSSFIVK